MRPTGRTIGCGCLVVQAHNGKGVKMSLLAWALIFLVVAIIAAAFGFGGIATASAGIAKVLFFIFLVIFIVLLVMNMMGRGA